MAVFDFFGLCNLHDDQSVYDCGLKIEVYKWFVYADDANCGTPTWIGKGLTCVCFKAKGNYERICLNLTPPQASND